MKYTMKIMVFTLALILSGCVTIGGMKKNADTIFSGEIKGNYSALARCVSDTMEVDNRWTIRTLQYYIRVYPDIERSEVEARIDTIGGPVFIFHMELNQTAPGVSSILLKGSEYEGGEALKALQGCAEK